MDDLHKRIYEISHKNKSSHISSCLSVSDIADKIFREIDNDPNNDDIVILSKGHGGLGLYANLEKWFGHDAELLYKDHGVHPKLDIDRNIYCSSGSLGQGITVACGYALANRKRKVHCIISDGEWYEGSTLESLNFAGEYGLDNLIIHLDLNGYSAYKEVNMTRVEKITKSFGCKMESHYFGFKDIPFFLVEPLAYHYYVLKDEDWEKIKNL